MQNVTNSEVMANIATILSANRSAQSNGQTIAVFKVIKELQQSALISANETRSMMRGVLESASNTADIAGKGVAVLQSQLRKINAVTEDADMVDTDAMAALSFGFIPELLVQAEVLFDADEDVTSLGDSELECVCSVHSATSSLHQLLCAHATYFPKHHSRSEFEHYFSAHPRTSFSMTPTFLRSQITSSTSASF